MNKEKEEKKFLEDFYPNLNWGKSYYGVIGINKAENECSFYFNEKYKSLIKRWEYGYYFLMLLFRNTTLHKSYSIIIALYSESIDSLRCSFLNNINGYHPESLSLLRRVHECTIKMIACKDNPEKTWTIIQSSSLQKTQSELKINFSWIYKLQGNYLHANKLKLIDIGKKWNSKGPIGISYGPQLNDKEFIVSMNLSIFWIYILILVASRLYPGQISKTWLDKHKESCKLFRDYLQESILPTNKLLRSIEEIEKILNRIDEDK